MDIQKMRDWAIVLFIGSQLLLNVYTFSQGVLVRASQDQQTIQELRKQLEAKEKK